MMKTVMMCMLNILEMNKLCIERRNIYMATSGSFSTNQVAATTRVWYWDFSWSVSSWSGNTANGIVVCYC